MLAILRKIRALRKRKKRPTISLRGELRIKVSVRSTISLVVVLSFLSLFTGCTGIPIDQRAAVRNELETSSKETRTRFEANVPGLDKDLAAAAGYFTALVSGGQAPIVGGTFGRGVLVDNANSSHTFMNASRFDLGAGLGAGTYRVMVILETREAFEEFRGGFRKFGVGAGLAAGDSGGGISSFSGDGFRFLIASESGAVATVSARMLKFSVNEDLTDTGVSEVSVPGTNFDDGDDEPENAPRVWDHALPFLAQKVVDLGYDLPLPYGTGAVVARVDQDQLIDSLEVGINGRDKELFEFVSFGQAVSSADSANLMLDAWILPFLNVYATLGKVEGDADIEILIDGDGMLEHMDITCGGILQNPLCGRLQGQTFLLPIPTDFKGTTYGVGATLAGGWNNWFVAIPFNYSTIDLEDAMADGNPIFTIAPRFGHIFNIGRFGNLAFFAGGNYLDAELELSGTYLIPVEGQELSFDYTVQQENKDKWNVVTGMNWDFNKRLSWALEYDGFIGSREAFISSVTWRF